MVIPDSCAGLRLDQALARILPEYSRSRIKALIERGQVFMDGVTVQAKRKVWGGEAVCVGVAPSPAETANRPEPIPLDIVYEDASLIVINKPPGLVVHPGSGNWQGTLLNALLHHCPSLAGIPRAGIVHRLDKETSGLLVVAKTLPAQASLVKQLESRTVSRDYLALVQGKVLRDGRVEAPIGRHPVNRTRMAVTPAGKPAATRYRVRERLPGCTLLECSLETGRTHQIRVHMQAIGHPLVGDPLYGKRSQPELAFGRQALHAFRLALIHPETGKPLGWEAPLPSDFQLLLARLRSQTITEK